MTIIAWKITPPHRVKVKENLSRVSAHVVIPALLTFSLLAASCVYDRYDTAEPDGATVGVELNIMTRAMTSNSQTYEVGSQWENYIDITGGDYKIYFFTYNPQNTSDAGTNNTLIAEFVPTEMTAVEDTGYTEYTLAGEVGDDIVAYSDFKLVVLANWGTYPSVTAGTTTIDDLVEGDNTTFSAETFLSGVDESHLIPFYGVREYSGVSWRQGWVTTLTGEITLLRAVAKVEVVFEPGENQDDLTFVDVSAVNYNATGYCAPSGVYLRNDYDHDYTWAQDFTSSLHLVGSENDSDAKSLPFIKTKDKVVSSSGTVTQYETWTAYLPEYDNTSTDYSYMTVKTNYQMSGDDPFTIYFANYTDGVTTAYGDGESTDMPDRYDIFRNCLYRFRIKIVNHTLVVVADDWEEVFDNEYEFDTEG